MEADESECADFEWSDLIGKRVLVGITFQDRRGNVLDRKLSLPSESEFHFNALTKS